MPAGSSAAIVSRSHSERPKARSADGFLIPRPLSAMVISPSRVTTRTSVAPLRRAFCSSSLMICAGLASKKRLTFEIAVSQTAAVIVAGYVSSICSAPLAGGRCRRSVGAGLRPSACFVLSPIRRFLAGGLCWPPSIPCGALAPVADSSAMRSSAAGTPCVARWGGGRRVAVGFGPGRDNAQWLRWRAVPAVRGAAGCSDVRAGASGWPGRARGLGRLVVVPATAGASASVGRQLICRLVCHLPAHAPGVFSHRRAARCRTWDASGPRSCSPV